MEGLKVSFCFVIMACAMYFPLKDQMAAKNKEKNIKACMDRFMPDSTNMDEYLEYQFRCKLIYQKGGRVYDALIIHRQKYLDARKRLGLGPERNPPQ